MLASTGLPSLQLRFFQTIALILIVFALLHTARLIQFHRLDSRSIGASTPYADELLPEEQYLEKLKEEHSLTKEIEWRAWRIQGTEGNFEWQPSTSVRVNFESFQPQVFNIKNPDRLAVQAKARMELPVPKTVRSDKMDPSDFLFGISTTYQRLKEGDFRMLRTWSRWMTDGHRKSNGVALALFLDQATAGELGEVQLVLQTLGIEAYVANGKLPMSMAKRYYELSKTLKAFSAVLSATGVQKTWYALVEDDVFFPSVAHLKNRLSRYDPETPQYIGMPSEREDWEQDGDAVTTHGGGALFFTRSALSQITKAPCFAASEGHELAFKAKSWDVLLKQCAQEHTDLKMRVLPGFYSPKDHIINDNPELHSYESGSRPLVLHDYAGRHGIDVDMAHSVTHICGEACFMQRYIFNDDWVLVNGVSLTHYPSGVKYGDDAMERPLNTSHDAPVRTSPDSLTIDDDDSERTHFGWKGGKQTWMLLDSTVDNDGMVWQAYIRRAAATPTTGKSATAVEEIRDTDSIIVLLWENDLPQEL